MSTETAASTHAVEVIDLETGNIGSVLNMLARIGCKARIVKRADELEMRDPVLLPGVGHFTQAAEALDRSQLRPKLDALHERDWPVLGICLGAQLMCKASEEGAGTGLGWMPTTVRRFPSVDQAGRPLRVPHMEWQPFAPPDGCLPFNMDPGRVYFAHSFFIDPEPLGDASVCESEFGGVRFTSVARRRRAIGAQFHPEKSHRHGMAFLSSWVRWAHAEVKAL